MLVTYLGLFPDICYFFVRSIFRNLPNVYMGLQNLSSPGDFLGSISGVAKFVDLAT